LLFSPHPVAAALLAAALAAATGCGEKSKYVPVSGVVRVNGKPYPNAMVYFQPVGSKEDPNPGRGSTAKTDESGRFVLKTEDDKDGAVVGKHQIKVRTYENNNMVGYDPAKGSSDRQPEPPRGKVDPIPADWRSIGDHTFEVPAGGTDQANFDISNPNYRN
jgi:hypothetical protein